MGCGGGAANAVLPRKKSSKAVAISECKQMASTDKGSCVQWTFDCLYVLKPDREFMVFLF
jgi:hypothetical protein